MRLKMRREKLERDEVKRDEVGGTIEGAKTPTTGESGEGTRKNRSLKQN